MKDFNFHSFSEVDKKIHLLGEHRRERSLEDYKLFEGEWCWWEGGGC